MARTPAELRALFETTANQDALLDTADEVWVRRVEDYFYVLHIWQSGRMVPAVSPRAQPRLRVRERVTAWNLVDGLAIEREVYDEAIVVRRTHLNGPIHVSVEAPGTPLELPPGFRATRSHETPPFTKTADTPSTQPSRGFERSLASTRAGTSWSKSSTPCATLPRSPRTGTVSSS